MPRFVLVRGKAPHLIDHPGIAAGAVTKRFAGWRELDAELKPTPCKALSDHYEPVDELLSWSHDMVRAKPEFAVFRVIDAPTPDMARKLAGLES